MFKRGQASWGAMELVIGAIILGMSMTIVYYAWQNISNAQCIAEVRAETTSLESAILDVSMGAPPTRRQVKYEFKTCGGQALETIRFVYYGKPEYCRRCESAVKGCWMIEPTFYDVRANRLYVAADAVKCVNMPADVQISLTSSATCVGDTTNTPYPGVIPGRTAALNSIAPTDDAKRTFAGVTSSVYGGTTSCSSGISCWQTFTRKADTPRSVVFELEKAIQPSSSIGVVQICAKKS